METRFLQRSKTHADVGQTASPVLTVQWEDGKATPDGVWVVSLTWRRDMRWFSFISLLPARSESLAARSWLYAERMAIYTCGLGPLVTRSSSHHSFRHPHARDSWSSILSALHTLHAPTFEGILLPPSRFPQERLSGQSELNIRFEWARCNE